MKGGTSMKRLYSKKITNQDKNVKGYFCWNGCNSSCGYSCDTKCRMECKYHMENDEV